MNSLLNVAEKFLELIWWDGAVKGACASTAVWTFVLYFILLRWKDPPK